MVVLCRSLSVDLAKEPKGVEWGEQEGEDSSPSLAQRTVHFYADLVPER